MGAHANEPVCMKDADPGAMRPISSEQSPFEIRSGASTILMDSRWRRQMDQVTSAPQGGMPLLGKIRTLNSRDEVWRARSAA